MEALKNITWETRTDLPLGLETAAILFGHNRGSPSVDFFLFRTINTLSQM